MVTNHYINFTAESRIEAFLRIYEIIVDGGKYDEQNQQSAKTTSRKRKKTS